MKYTTIQLLNMTEEERSAICHDECDTSRCPFKKSLRPYREDGYCLADTFRLSSKWLREIDFNIEHLQEEIQDLKIDRKHYEKLINKFKKEITNGSN